MGYGQQVEVRGWPTRIRARLLASRRRFGTGAAIAIAILLAYHVVAGNNGLRMYRQKMAEDHQLAAEVKQLQQENVHLKEHVDHLASDPDAIEYEAHLRLRYARPGQVIVLNDAKAAAPAPEAAK